MKHHSTRQVIFTGAAVVLASAILLIFPALIPLGTAAKYLVAFGLIGCCIGVSLLLHGAWDRWQGK